MTDIVERLRRYAEDNRQDGFGSEAAVKDEAVDEIERLRRDRDDYKQLYADALRDYVEKCGEVKRLREALHRIEDDYYVTGGMARKIARAALEGKDG